MSPAITSVSNLTKLEEIKSVIRSLLISMGSKDVSLQLLNNIYKEEEDQDIPFKDFNYTSLKDFLKSMPDVVRLNLNKNKQLCVYHIDTEKSKHITHLVSKAKKNTEEEKQKSRLKALQYGNTVDPSILFRIFKKLLAISLNYGRKNTISKSDVLSEIASSFEERIFYNMDNLNRQLNELTHILTYDDNNIYFKSDSTAKIVENNLKLKLIEKRRQNKIDLKKKNPAIILESLSDLVRENTKIRLQKLMQKHTQGIWCSELPNIYRHEYGLDLEYSDLGFNSIIEFIIALPDIFRIVNVPNIKKQKIIDSRIAIDDYLNSQNIALMSHDKFDDQYLNNIEAVPQIVSAEVSKSFIPDSVMGYGETVELISVISLLKEKYEDVIVSDVFSPSFFWVTVLKNKRKIKKLMTELQEHYSLKELDKYIIPPIILKPGLHVACIFDKKWHRAVIKKIKTDNIYVFFYDYGTISSYKADELYFLDKKFSSIPAQAIPCCLHNIQPLNDNQWSKDINKRFSEKVLNKPFISSILSIDKERNFMVLKLINPNDGSMISDWMKMKQFAVDGNFICTKSRATVKHCQESMKTKTEYDARRYFKEMKNIKNSIHHTSHGIKSDTSHSISYNKILAAVRRYKERSSFSSDTSYPHSLSDDAGR